MEPTAAMAHTRLADSSIPEPTGEAAVTDASARKKQKERQKGREPGKGRRGEERWEDRSLTSFPGLRPAFIPAGTKTASPSPALTALPLNPLQHALYHIHTHHREQHTHTHTCAVFCIFEKKTKRLEQEEMEEGDDQ